MGLAASISATVCGHLDTELSKIRQQQEEQSNQLSTALRDALRQEEKSSNVSSEFASSINTEDATDAALAKQESATVHIALPTSIQIPALVRAASESPRAPLPL